MSRSRAPSAVTVQDILEYDLDDHPITTNGMKPYGERFIHSGIYKARADVQSVIHSHSPAVIPFSVSDVPLRPISNSGGFLMRDVPVFEIRDSAGNATDMLVKNKDLGDALAKKLGDANVVLMRGHGMAVVGNSIRLVVSHAVYAERNAQLQTQALRLGSKVTYLTQEEAAATGNFMDSQADRPWEMWAEQAIAHEIKH
jgi:HCOMODA/2-hydroxy-3-carboxy-muconic semialdehyde decarboxylase